MASEPNQVGSPHDKANADFMLAQYQSWGWDARIETFSVYYATPKSETLELVAPVALQGQAERARGRGDRTSGKPGRTAALQRLRRRRRRHGGPGLRELRHAGRLHRARAPGHRREGQGRDRPLRLRLARDSRPSSRRSTGRSAASSIPTRTRTATGPATSTRRAATARGRGPARIGPRHHPVFRGPADPGGRGHGGREAPRPGRRQDDPQDPVCRSPTATPSRFLAALEGPVAPPPWRGALPLTYHIGPGPAKVHLAIASDWGQKPIYDVIAVMQGLGLPEPVGDPRQPP
jgi:N-acetylated-alpha-linked acidic dipeptidase